jgi:hypothetical protein
MNGEQLAEEQMQRIRLLEAAEVASLRVERSNEPFFRVFSEIGRWIRLQAFRDASGLSKEAVAICSISNDINGLMRSIGNISIGLLRIQAQR